MNVEREGDKINIYFPGVVMVISIDEALKIANQIIMLCGAKQNPITPGWINLPHPEKPELR